ncbi:bifunctional DNA primase/polymerase [Nocardia araoensis]|uniref:bifunctional DNA primase/polymerase n=1 Tax=Nocardia araoensis TaxID=228600 RepID=UPI0002E4F063|nr:bifunctional DNA primase/polymerase [Nocardia araoensis]
MTVEALPLEYALAYARAGLSVLPLAPRGKLPACAHGKDDATTDPEVIRAWWHQNPRYNVGIRPSDTTVVLDIDPRSGGTLEQLGEVPETWTAHTGGGGWHLWFRYRGRCRGKLADAVGVDVKTAAGYLVVAPSMHPSGRRYEWANSARIAPLPDHLVERVAYPVRQQYRARPSSDRNEGLIRTVATAAPGNRNQALFWAACRAFEQGADPGLMDLLRAAAATAGLSAPEIERTLMSAERRRA